MGVVRSTLSLPILLLFSPPFITYIYIYIYAVFSFATFFFTTVSFFYCDLFFRYLLLFLGEKGKCSVSTL